MGSLKELEEADHPHGTGSGESPGALWPRGACLCPHWHRVPTSPLSLILPSETRKFGLTYGKGGEPELPLTSFCGHVFNKLLKQRLRELGKVFLMGQAPISGSCVCNCGQKSSKMGPKFPTSVHVACTLPFP